MTTFDEGPQSYGIQTINQRGQSNAGQMGGYGASWGLGGGSGMRGPYGGPKTPEQIAQEQQQLQQRRLMAAQQQAQQQGSQNEQMVQQQMQNAAPVQNYVDSWQMTPEKIAAYRAQKLGGTAMQQPQGGISNGQMSGQQAIANLLRMLGLG